MLLGGKGGCQQCTCVPCDACTAECTNPHTGSAFETVYTLFFEGAESGNVGDGYLTASGDSDTSDPYDGMDGNGPWFQQVVGTFTLNSTQTRHPCRVIVSFWRNNFVLGASTIPPPSAALTSQSVKVEVTAGAVVVGDRVIVPADGEVTIDTVSIPLVSGGGDQSENDPRFWEGSIAVIPQCDSATFSIRARIEWNVKKRQHVLYGIVRECYEDPPNPCDSFCGGSGKPSDLYVTLTNLSFSNAKYIYAGDGTSPGPADTVYTTSIISDWQSLLTSAVTTSRVLNFCNQWQECLDVSAGLCSPCVGVAYKDSQYGYGGLTGVDGAYFDNLSVFLMSKVNYLAPGVLGGCNEWVLIVFTLGDHDPCAPFDESGSATGSGRITSNFSGYGGITFDATCDWHIES
jgi:hypothetical protein